jgi:starch-binding outer membrane protein, SusD/RagB family
MKINKINCAVLIAAGIFTFTSCSEDFLQVNPTGTNLEENYYLDENQAYSALVAVYDLMRKQSGGFENMVTMLNAGSDDNFAGGGNASDGAGIQSFAIYSINSSTIPRSYWSDFYQGIFRANVLLERLPDVPMDEAVKARFTAEAKALRAFYYFELVTMFRNIPLITTPLEPSEFYTKLQDPPEAVYAQIEQDLNEAIPDLPAMLNIATEAGRLNRGAAQAILGKVYLYQHKDAQAAQMFAEVNGDPAGANQYGYELLDNYADLWVVDNKYNSESILETAHTQQSNTIWDNWGSGTDEGNSINTMVGPRGYSPIGNGPRYRPGWSFNTFTLDFIDFMAGDPRFDATVLDMNALVANNLATYTPAHNDTGYFLKKFMPTDDDLTDGGGEQILNFRQNYYVIRLADTYLLEAEALGGTGARAQALLNAVRARVGLPPVPVSLQAVWDERRRELAGEGHRWKDLVRTGRAPQILGSRGFVADKNEIWPIPLLELSNTQIQQNPNYN